MNIPSNNRRNYTTQWVPMTIGQAYARWGNVPWHGFLQNYASSSGSNVNPSYLMSNPFVVSAAAYYDNLNTYLTSLESSTSSKQWRSQRGTGGPRRLGPTGDPKKKKVFIRTRVLVTR